MALHDNLPIYRSGVRLLDLAVKVQVQMPRTVKRALGEKITQHCVEMLDLMALDCGHRPPCVECSKYAAPIPQQVASLLALLTTRSILIRLYEKLGGVIKSSAPMRCSDKAAQFPATKGPVRRAPLACMALAKTSLPTPDSPVISTVASRSATWWTRRWWPRARRGR